jgi:hypothetical protein
LPPADIEFSMPPAFQNVTETAAYLYFGLEQPSAGAVLFRGGGGNLQTIPFTAEAERHFVSLQPLEPGSHYDVVVALGDEASYSLPLFQGQPWGAQNIATPPYPEPLRFAVIADSGFADPVTPELIRRMAAAEPHLVLLPGDIVYRVEEQGDPAEAYRLKYFAPFAPILRRAPVYPAVGNHELDAPAWWQGAPYYYTAFPPVTGDVYVDSRGRPLRKWHAFAFGSVQFLSLNSQAMFGDEGRAEQDAWLAARLSDPDYTLTIPFFHISPVSSSLHQAEGRNLASWVEQFEAAGLPLVISAHDHAYERLAQGGTTYIVSGGGSATLYSLRTPHPASQVFASVSHFTLFETYGDRIELRAIGVDGAEIDRATLPRAQ